SFPGITPQKVALSMYPMGPTLKQEFPEVVEFARTANAGGVLRHGDQQMVLERAFWTNAAFLTMFDFPLLAGERKTALQEPNSIVLTEAASQKLLGTKDGLGMTVQRDTISYKVTGILAKVPDYSHLQFEVLISVSTLNDERLMRNWGGNWLTTYLEVTPGTDVQALERKFPAFVTKYMQEGAIDYYKLYLQPLREVHLGSTDVTHDYRNWQKFDITYVYVFSALAIFVLIIACINFMNISTSRAASRAKEVGIRKSVGAFRMQVAKQFMGESVILSFLSLVMALLLVYLFLPSLNTISQRSLELNMLRAPTFLLGLFLFTVCVGVLAGVYPALFLSSFQPATVLKGYGTDDGRKNRLRNVLVVAQFTISIALIVGTAVAANQLNFMRSRNIGINKKQVLLVPMRNLANQKYDLLKQKFLELAGVKGVTASGQRLGNNLHQWGIRAASGDTVRQLSPSNVSVDYNYMSFYGLDLLQGREFSEEFSTDERWAYIVNESFVKELGWQSPLGKEIGLSGRDSLGSVIGVVRDFNFNSLHHKIQPLVLSVQGWGFSEMSVRISVEDMQQTIRQIERVWNELVTDYPFQYSFLDDHFAHLYQSDKQVSQVITIVAALAIVIACLGLFGLTSITTAQRTKEMGVRKVLGASIGELLVLLTKGFAKLVLIAFLIASPITYFVMQDWLHGFAYRAEVGFELFVLAGSLAMLIALLTVSYHAIQTASANPVKALRYE
ncbi:ABC transporter permease, partial [bacterium]|nr:ABC transporter permease [bacterium]